MTEPNPETNDSLSAAGRLSDPVLLTAENTTQGGALCEGAAATQSLPSSSSGDDRPNVQHSMCSPPRTQPEKPIAIRIKHVACSPCAAMSECDCQNCVHCETCKLYAIGDEIELSVHGAAVLGRRTVHRGRVAGQIHRRGRPVTILVKWEGLPASLTGQVTPSYIQKRV